ncbi:MAG TPA: alanine--tRNA ligase [Candidatus Polarisedimenticolia bacterium]|nr:alanine--tRNA ligase [Candidatus Polarisedimenticolia bacterium]
MKGSEVRSRFLGYFEERGHARVRSSSLIPSGDPTLLFSNAGMNQFKEVFLGRETRAYRRAASSQKCLRVSGKHNDFDQVGRTARHHTFFEILGNFSFGDYFKREAIAFAWELVTRELAIPAARLWVTVFRDDEEAAALWPEVAGLPPSRVVRLGEKDNFWAMGDTGPCGPCSEIYFDQGPGVGCRQETCSVACGCDRYLEFWNLVFMQFDRQPDGSMKPLAAPSIDTGAGLERLAAILQGVDSNYKSDLFLPLIESIAGRSGARYGADQASDVSLQVIADHLRALTFLIADGVIPSNEKRGYILRRIIRRALAYGRNLGLEKPFLHEHTGDVVAMMGGAYPELARERARIAEVCRREEETFGASLARGLEVAGDTFSQYQGTTLDAAETVRLWTTYGVTTEIQEALAPRYRVTMPGKEAIEAEMEKHREAARASWKGQEDPRYPRELLELPARPGWQRTLFRGYETLSEAGRIEHLATPEGLVETLGEGQVGFVVLDRTPFYAESGGQVGDTGRLAGQEGSVAEVDDTQSPAPGLIVHIVRVLSGSLQRGERVQAQVDPQARAATMRNHTATHLLHAALKRVLGEGVQQAGSYVGPDRLRFDFNYPSPLSRQALDRVEDEVNEQILLDAAVGKVEKDFDEAMAGGAVALFGEKYGDRVRVVTVPGYSQELCGGTHCSGTGEIGSLRIISERGIAAGVRRIEALTGLPAVVRAREDARLLAGIEELLRSPREAAPEALVNVLAAQKAQARELERLKLRLAQAQMQEGAGSQAPPPREVAGVRLIARRVEGLDRPAMRTLADNLKREAGSAVVVLASASEGKVSLLAAITPDLEGRLDARALIKDLAGLVGGGGGGNALLAEAGGRNPGRIQDVIEQSAPILERHLAASRAGS